MDVTIMESTTSLVKQLKNANFATPNGKPISFSRGGGFYWSPKSTTVFYNSSNGSAPELLLHELGHALLGHGDYSKDIELIAMERDAWEQALLTGKRFKVPIADDLVEEYLDSYRDWLHARSLCPYCAATGVQTAVRAYVCANCGGAWGVNEARTCALKRYKTT